MDKKEKKSLPEPRTYTVEQIAAMLNIGRTTAYQLVKQEEFRIVRISQERPVSETAALNPDWVEWLMGFPKGWTDVSSGPPNRKESPA